MCGGSRRCQRTSSRHLCARCRERKARYQYRGVVRADRQHVLCFQCFRSAREQLRAWNVREGLPGGWLELRRPEAMGAARQRPPLTERQTAHRQQMLAHLERLSASGG